MTESTKSSSKIKLYCPIEQTWTISEEQLNELNVNSDDDDSDSEDDTDEKNINSDVKEVAAVPSVKYTLELTNRDKDEDYAIFLNFLHIENLKIHGKYSFFIKSANYFVQYDIVFNPDNLEWGGGICNIDDMFDSERKFIIDGKLTIEMKGILIIEVDEMPKIPYDMNPLGQGLWERDDKDFKIIVGTEKEDIIVHKIVLATRSSVFDAMFRSGMEEAKTNTLKIPDFALKTVQAAIEFFYCRDIFQTLTLDNAFELLRFADKYNVNDLQLKLDTYFSYHLSPSTVCQLANGAIILNYVKLRDICFDFLMVCLRHAISVDNLDALDKDLAAELFRKAFSPASD